MLPKENRGEIIMKKIEAFRKVFEKTKFGGSVQIVPVAAAVGADEQGKETIGIDELVQTLVNTMTLPDRNKSGPFYYLIDHCFNIKGQGTVVTGTVLQGQVQAGQEVEFPDLKQIKKVKSIQMFKKPVERAIQGDRVGILFTQLDSKTVSIKKSSFRTNFSYHLIRSKGE